MIEISKLELDHAISLFRNAYLKRQMQVPPYQVRMGVHQYDHLRQDRDFCNLLQSGKNGKLTYNGAFLVINVTAIGLIVEGVKDQ